MSRILEFEPSDPEDLVRRIIYRVSMAASQQLPGAPPLEPGEFGSFETTLQTERLEITKENNPDHDTATYDPIAGDHEDTKPNGSIAGGGLLAVSHGGIALAIGIIAALMILGWLLANA